MLKRRRLVKSITGLGNIGADAVVNRRHGLTAFVKLQAIRNACPLPLPFVTNVSVTSARFGAASILVEVEPEKRGSRNSTRPLEPSESNGSKSVISLEKSGPDTEFVNVSNVPSTTVLFEM